MRIRLGIITHGIMKNLWCNVSTTNSLNANGHFINYYDLLQFSETKMKAEEDSLGHTDFLIDIINTNAYHSRLS